MSTDRPDVSKLTRADFDKLKPKRSHGGEAEANSRPIAITEAEAAAADTYRRSVFGKSKYYKPTTAIDDNTPPPVPAHVHYDYTQSPVVREYDRAHKLRRKETSVVHECVTMWSFTMTVHGMKNTSPRRFTTMQEALAAIGERMAMHAQDNEFPMFALVRFKR